MLNALLIDDEEQARSGLRSMLDLFCPDVTIVAESDSAIDGIIAIRKHHPDLVFLDVEMPGASGFTVLEGLDNPSFQTIFVTAYNQYAIKALRFNALDYLLKPVDPDDLVKAVKRASERIVTKVETDYAKLIHTVNNRDFEQIGVPTTNGVMYLPVRDIVFLSASNNYTEVHLQDQKPMLVSRTIKTFESTLEGLGFMRIHQSHIINLNAVREWQRTDGGRVVLTSGDSLPVSRAKRAALEEALRSRFPNL